ncbi:MAG: PfkB family carbohydrate kinase [Kiritimatiellia bacterium]
MKRAENANSAGAGQPVPVLVFGEVLVDGFPDGRRVLGGAPFNVAWGLKGFGQDPLLVSAVGADVDGRRIRDRMAAWGLRREGLQTAPAQATGEVRIELRNGEPRYEICQPRAWDFIRDEGFGAARVLCHGLLALRNETSRATFAAIQARSAGALRFFDVNLRPPFDGPDLLKKWIHGVDWLKLNLDELNMLLGRADATFADAPAQLERLRGEYGIRNVLLTAGAEGLRIQGEYGEAVCSPAPPPPAWVDAVGAGDSISAVAIDGLLRGRSAPDIAAAAGRFAARVCGLPGAITEEKEFYRHE